jgi:hypothetical protein
MNRATRAFVHFTLVGILYVVTVLFGLATGGVMGNWFLASAIFVIALLGAIPGLLSRATTPSYVSFVICFLYVGQEVVEHRASARSRVVPIAYDEFAPLSGIPVMAGGKQVGTLRSTAKGRGLALMRLDRIEDALASGITLDAGGIPIRTVKPGWAKFDWPGETKVAT